MENKYKVGMTLKSNRTGFEYQILEVNNTTVKITELGLFLFELIDENYTIVEPQK